MPDFSAVKNAPDISFIDNKTVEDVRDEMVADYEEYMTQSTGQTVTLPRFQPPSGRPVCGGPANLSSVPVY